MTRAEALAEAKRRWGPEAVVSSWRHIGAHGKRRGQRWEYQVGCMEGVGEEYGATWKGSGDSWEAAFADADARSSR